MFAMMLFGAGQPSFLEKSPKRSEKLDKCSSKHFIVEPENRLFSERGKKSEEIDHRGNLTFQMSLTAFTIFSSRFESSNALSGTREMTTIVPNSVDSRNYYNFFRDSEKTTFHEISWSSLTRLVLTILLRIGFLLVQIGSVPVTNINLILLQNIVDFSWVTLVYVLGGFVIAYNGDVAGVIGKGEWIGDVSATDKDEILVGWEATIVASAIATCCLVGRAHTVAYLLVGLILAGLVQPLAIHWVWTSNGWMARSSLLSRNVTFVDYAGSALVHAVGSLTGYIGCSVLGRRIIRLRDIDDASLPADSAGTALAGYFLILLGLQSLCFPTTMENDPRASSKQMSMILVNNLLASSSCSLMVIALHFILNTEPFNYWTVMRCVQASIAGTTIVSAGVNFYNPLLCLGLGCTAGIVHYLVSRRLFQSALEDYCNIVATHLVTSIIGSAFAPLGDPNLQSVKDPITILVHVAWQLVCLVTICALVALPILLALGILQCLGLLRNRTEIVNHLRAVVAAERGPARSCMQRLFLPDRDTLYLQPCTAHAEAHEKAAPEISDRVEGSRKNMNSRMFVSNSSPSLVYGTTRMKKARQVHTLRSSSEVAILPTPESKKAMGDDGGLEDEPIRDKFEKKTVLEKKFGIECSGDSTERFKLDSSFVQIFSGLKTTEKREEGNRNAPDENSYRQYEPYRLHRTRKCTNLRLEAIKENDPSVRFLVRPREKNFSSTESESEKETLEIIYEKCAKNSSKSNSLVRKTLACMDVRS